MTTAQARELAREAEAKLDWAKDAELYQFAVDNYPAHNGSQLAIHDIERLQLKADSCRQFAESLAEREEGYDIMDDFNWVGSRHHY